MKAFGSDGASVMVGEHGGVAALLARKIKGLVSIHCVAHRAALAAAQSLDLSGLRHPYGDGRAGLRIADLLATADFRAIPLRKRNAY